MKWSYCFLPLLALVGTLAADEPDFETKEPLEGKAKPLDVCQYGRVGVMTPLPIPFVGYGVRMSRGYQGFDLSLNYTNLVIEPEGQSIGVKTAYILYLGEPEMGFTPYVSPSISAGFTTYGFPSEKYYANAEISLGGEFRSKKDDKRSFVQIGINPMRLISLSVGISL